jgi:hypothetical protein
MMDVNILAPWRDLSVVWLGLLTFIFLLIPLLAFFFAQLYLRRFNRWLRLPLLNAQVWALRIEQGVSGGADRIAAAAIAMHGTSAQVSTTAHGVIDFLRNK